MMCTEDLTTDLEPIGAFFIEIERRLVLAMAAQTKQQTIHLNLKSDLF